MKKTRILELIAPVLLLSGCGMCFDGFHQTVAIDGSPAGVEIYRDGKPVGKTPLMLEVRRKGGAQMLVAKKEGYNDQTLIMESRMGTGGVLDIISSATALTGVFGLTTDGTSGTLWEYQPGHFYVNMIRVGEENRPVSKMKLFVSRNWHVLENEAGSGDGEGIRALSEMTGVSKSELCSFIKDSSYPSQLISKLSALMPDDGAAFETANVEKPKWVELYEKDGFIGQYDRMNRNFIGYGEGASFKSARAEAYEDLLAKVQQQADNKAVLSELRLVSEYKSEGRGKVKVWLMYTYPVNRL